MRCEAIVNTGVWPYAQRCENFATITTEDGAHYCGEHENWDEE